MPLNDRQIRTTELKEDRVNSLGMALNGVLQGPRGQARQHPPYPIAQPGQESPGAVERALLSLAARRKFCY